ncbi:MAG: DUF4249 family protein [Bacteroidales bacterium]|nr:DUF4249 family protein [Bacteroidales bacterium]
MRTTTIAILALIILHSCEPEFNPLVEAPPIPVVYALLDSQDSTVRVKITKSFALDQAFKRENIPAASLEFPKARVWLERWNGDYLYFRSELNPIDCQRESGLFPALPNPVYVLQHDETNGRIFDYPNKHDLIKLIIDIPEQPLIYSQITPLREAHIKYPTYNGEKIHLYSENGLSPSFIASAYYIEGWVSIEYTDHYYDSDTNRITKWRDYHIDATMLNAPPWIITAERFLRRTAVYIPDDKAVRYRTFRRLWITIYGADQNFFEYTMRANISPIDQSGHPFSNLVNGMGLFAATCTAKKWATLDYFSLDSLCNGQYTKHLRFKHW